jgi:hypothetical protein
MNDHMGQNVGNPCDQPILSLRADLYGSQSIIRFLGKLVTKGVTGLQARTGLNAFLLCSTELLVHVLDLPCLEQVLAQRMLNKYLFYENLNPFQRRDYFINGQ